MTYELLVRPEAESDISEAYDWYENQRTGLGSEFVLCTEATLESIQRNPNLYPIVHKNIHRALIRRFPFGIFYIVEENEIIVLSVFHARRDPKWWEGSIK